MNSQACSAQDSIGSFWNNLFFSQMSHLKLTYSPLTIKIFQGDFDIWVFMNGKILQVHIINWSMKKLVVSEVVLL